MYGPKLLVQTFLKNLLTQNFCNTKISDPKSQFFQLKYFESYLFWDQNKLVLKFLIKNLWTPPRASLWAYTSVIACYYFVPSDYFVRNPIDMVTILSKFNCTDRPKQFVVQKKQLGYALKCDR